MFRITVTDDDQYSPLNGVVTVASIEEAAAIIGLAEPDEDYGIALEAMMPGDVSQFYDFQVTYTVERVK